MKRRSILRKRRSPGRRIVLRQARPKTEPRPRRKAIIQRTVRQAIRKPTPMQKRKKIDIPDIPLTGPKAGPITDERIDTLLQSGYTMKGRRLYNKEGVFMGEIKDVRGKKKGKILFRLAYR